MTHAQYIREYVDDHYKSFGFYPHDVEVDETVYNYAEYWRLLDNE